MTVLIAVVGVALWDLYLRPERQPPERVSIAVLPFENLSKDPEQEYFSDGITEALITKLAKISAMYVPSRKAVSRFKGTRPYD